jgi:hypothetical protein
VKNIVDNPNLHGLERLVKLFFAPSESSQAASRAFAARLQERKQDREPPAGPEVAIAQITPFRAWEHSNGNRFAKLSRITHPCLVVNGVFDNMIPVRNSYMLSEHLPNAMLLIYPDAGHGSLFQFHDSFARQSVAVSRLGEHQLKMGWKSPNEHKGGKKMSTLKVEAQSKNATRTTVSAATMDIKVDVMVIPVSDVDRARADRRSAAAMNAIRNHSQATGTGGPTLF